MARRYRPRKLFKFWLYHDLAEDVRLMEYIDYLHKTKQFVTMVRNGLRLMWTLGQGDMSVLFELFPTLKAQFTPDNSALIEEFRQLLSQNQLVVAPADSAPHSLPVALMDDDQDTVVLKLDTQNGANITTNFLGAAFGMSGAKLPTGILLDTVEAKLEPSLARIQDDDDDDYVPPLAPGAMSLKKMI